MLFLFLAAWCCEERASSAPTPAAPVTTRVDRIERAAKSIFGRSYAGISTNPLTVYTSGPIPARLDKALRGVRVRSVRYSYAELQSGVDRLAEQQTNLAEQGVALSTWGVDPATNSIRVGVVGTANGAEAKLRKPLGKRSIALTVVVQQLVSIEAAHETTTAVS